MGVTLHLSSGEKYEVNSTIEEITEDISTYGMDGGYLNFTRSDDKEDRIFIRHIVKLSEV